MTPRIQTSLMPSSSSPRRLSRKPGATATPLRAPVVTVRESFSRGASLGRVPRSQAGTAMNM